MIGTDSGIQAGLKFLEAEQEGDGGFLGHASANRDDFSVYRKQPTIFFTALILDCLSNVAGSESVRQPAADFLLKHKSPHWTWNYWISGAAMDQAYPYDLDDTACALVALHAHNPDLIDGNVLGHLAQHLINNESSPGGPYETWLVDRAAHPKWHDIDLAVNANIGYLLTRLGVQLPELESYITAALRAKNLQSSYYVGEIPLLYFVARWYCGPALPVLQRRIANHLLAIENKNPLHMALLLSAGIQVGLKPRQLAPAARQLLVTQPQTGSWPAAALYYEPLVAGRQYYAGSEALTTAFALEALSAYQRLHEPAAKSVRRPQGTTSHALSEVSDISDPQLRHRYRTLIRGLVKADHDGQVAGMASIVARACERPIAPRTIRNLNLASLHGWIAYTIYDDFLDGEGDAELLSVANLALRRSLTKFHNALPDNKVFAGLVAATFDQVDAANSWEVMHARTPLQQGKLYISKLPDYGNYSQLAARSWGHSLAAVGVLYGLGLAPDSPEVLSLQKFFHHFLIARQLNDDAHDWEADLQRGHLTVVVSLLLDDAVKLPGRINIDHDIELLSLHFWQETILKVAELINKHLQTAREALIDCQSLQDKTVFESWLHALGNSTQRALSERDETIKFIEAYEGHEIRN